MPDMRGITSPLSGLRTLTRAGGGGGPSTPVVTTLPQLVSTREGQFEALHDSAASGSTFALSAGIRLNGDSTMEKVRNSDDIADRTGFEVRMADFVSSTITNYGKSGDTLAQILVRMQASPQNAQYADNWIIQGGINDGTDTAQNAADWASIFALFSGDQNAWIGPHAGSTATTASASGVSVRKQYRQIVSDAPGYVWDRWLSMAESTVADIGGSGLTSDDRERIADGIFPKDYFGVPAPSTDNIHLGPNSLNPMAIEMARIGRALDDTSHAYVQTQMMTVDPTQAENSAIGTIAARGALANVTVMSGNDDSLVNVSSTGVITRGSGAFDLDAFRDVFISYEGTAGETQYARIVLGRWGASEVGQPVQFKKSDAAYSGKTVVMAETTGNYAEFSIIMLARHGVTDRLREVMGSYDMLGQVTASGSGIQINAVHNSATMKMRMNLRDSAGTLLASTITPTAPNDTDLAWYMFSFKQSTGQFQQGTNGTVATSTVGTTNPATFLDGIVLGSGLYPSDAEIAAFWLAPSFIDWTSSTERDRFFDSSTLAPVDIGTGVVNSITPDVYLHGGAGGYAGWIPPLDAHCALDLYGVPWVSDATTDLR